MILAAFPVSQQRLLESLNVLFTAYAVFFLHDVEAEHTSVVDDLQINGVQLVHFGASSRKPAPLRRCPELTPCIGQRPPSGTGSLAVAPVNQLGIARWHPGNAFQPRPQGLRLLEISKDIPSQGILAVVAAHPTLPLYRTDTLEQIDVVNGRPQKIVLIVRVLERARRNEYLVRLAEKRRVGPESTGLLPDGARTIYHRAGHAGVIDGKRRFEVVDRVHDDPMRCGGQ